jgi:hypothetical protein
MPDAESIAKLFHEAYERLAPAFGYETRVASRVTWEEVPERNRQLMIAVAGEVLALLFPAEEALISTTPAQESICPENGC